MMAFAVAGIVWPEVQEVAEDAWNALAAICPMPEQNAKGYRWGKGTVAPGSDPVRWPRNGDDWKLLNLVGPIAPHQSATSSIWHWQIACTTAPDPPYAVPPRDHICYLVNGMFKAEGHAFAMMCLRQPEL